MFLFHLSRDERRAFVGLAKHLIAADAREQPDEIGVLRLMERELGIPVAELPATPPRADVLATFSSKASRVAVLMELLTLAYADGEPHPEEMELLKTVAAGLQIPELRLLEMEDWIVRQLSLNAEANAFLRDEEQA
ncbi:MAG TPA: TerB family tellurite resistance protein [Polyangiaceae bacterium]|jgi:uncharacterized tellurite resistance protein B-like protein|nr:TerB family tellurite resistance protein [Polyangiaceae bacterium]